MDIKRIVKITFSPTGGTKRIVDAAAEGSGIKECLELDRTAFDSRWHGAELQEGDFAIIGMPVYYGRLPRIMLEFFRYIESRNIPAAVIVSYGNRDKGDALLELKNQCAEHGFIPLAGAAFIAQHSFTAKLGTGRPDADDLAAAAEFGRRAAELAAGAEDISALELSVPGSFPYAPAPDIPVGPATDTAKCSRCGLCQKNCPVQAINPADPAEVDGWRCLDCALCIQSCPAGAKYIGLSAMREKIAIMEALFTAPKSPEVYYAE